MSSKAECPGMRVFIGQSKDWEDSRLKWAVVTLATTKRYESLGLKCNVYTDAKYRWRHTIKDKVTLLIWVSMKNSLHKSGYDSLKHFVLW